MVIGMRAMTVESPAHPRHEMSGFNGGWTNRQDDKRHRGEKQKPRDHGSELPRGQAGEGEGSALGATVPSEFPAIGMRELCYPKESGGPHAFSGNEPQGQEFPLWPSHFTIDRAESHLSLTKLE